MKVLFVFLSLLSSTAYAETAKEKEARELYQEMKDLNIRVVDEEGNEITIEYYIFKMYGVVLGGTKV
jgi:uncharacterized protein with ParB-like and HNH nuclease domain